MATLVGQMECPWNVDATTEENMKTERAWLLEMQTKVREIYDGEYVGEVLQWQRGDGFAMYMVVSQRPLRLAHLVVGDGWTIEKALIRGLNMSDVKEIVARDRRMKSIFAKTTEEVS